jgi:hypothetical protein
MKFSYERSSNPALNIRILEKLYEHNKHIQYVIYIL